GNTRHFLAPLPSPVRTSIPHRTPPSRSLPGMECRYCMPGCTRGLASSSRPGAASPFTAMVVSLTRAPCLRCPGRVGHQDRGGCPPLGPGVRLGCDLWRLVAGNLRRQVTGVIARPRVHLVTTTDGTPSLMVAVAPAHPADNTFGGHLGRPLTLVLADPPATP